MIGQAAIDKLVGDVCFLHTCSCLLSQGATALKFQTVVAF